MKRYDSKIMISISYMLCVVCGGGVLLCCAVLVGFVFWCVLVCFDVFLVWFGVF